ncbi:MAG TPA: hypothetical protein VM617_08030 [Thermoanaerobaculia bacterium]|nr:hypothetical protein [Thermoanaerobaculia bacterium]
MRARHLLLPGLLIALALALVVGFRPGEEGSGVYVPVGYAREVDRLIAEDKLVYDCRSEAIEPHGLSASEEYFLRHSYLADDLAAWRANDRRLFVVEREELTAGDCRGRLLRINASYHNQRLPTYTASTWTGRLFLRQAAAATSLTSGERTLEVTRPDLDSLPLPAEDYQDVWFGRPESPDVRSPKHAWKMLERGRPFAYLSPVGDAAVLEVAHQRPELRLNACPVPSGWRVRLDGGDALRLRLAGDGGRVRLDERYQVEAGGDAGLLSFVRRVNGEIRRRTDTSRLPMADEVARALDTAVMAGDGRDDFDVHLTVDAFLDHTANRVLAEFAAGRYGRRPSRAAVTLLDADSGRTLALASHPAPSALGRISPRREGDVALLALNHNFAHHPVGSAAKPLLAAAALAAHPSLAGLTVPCFPGGASPDTLLGFPLGEARLPADCGGSGEDGEVSLVEFLRVSSNRYVLYLGMLALADWRAEGPRSDPRDVELSPGDRYRLAGRSFDRRPYLPVVKDDAGEGTELADVADRAFFRHFATLFATDFHYRSASPGERLDLGPWRPALAAAGETVGEEVALAFSPVAAEEVNLRANLVQQLRQDLYTTLLGLGNHRWSNLQLAAAVARLVTGRTDLEARLVERVTVPGEAAGEGSEDDAQAAEAAAPRVLWSLDETLAAAPAADGAAAGTAAAGLAEEHRRLILEGMRQVVSHPGGTAHALAAPLAALNEAAPAGVEYRLLAKTGTPSDTLDTLRRGVTVPAPGAVHRTPGGTFVDSAVLVLAIERTAPGEEASRRVLTLWIEGQGGSAEAVALAADLIPPIVQGSWPADWLE